MIVNIKYKTLKVKETKVLEHDVHLSKAILDKGDDCLLCFRLIIGAKREASVVTFLCQKTDVTVAEFPLSGRFFLETTRMCFIL